MRVLHLPSSYFPDALGGTEMYVAQLAEVLRGLGHQSVVAWHTRTTELGEGSVALPPLGVTSRRAMHCRDTGLDAPGFEKLLVSERPDLVHFHALTLGAGSDHARVAKRLGIPYLITFHTPAMACPRGTWMRYGSEPCDGRLEETRCSACVLQSAGWPRALARLGARSPLRAENLPEGPWQTHLALPSMLGESFSSWRAFFGGAGHVVACAKFVAERLLENGIPAERITVLRQALPGPSRRRQLSVRKVPVGGAIRLGFVGRFTPNKGPDLLIAAIDKLRARGMPCVVELVGPVLASEQTWASSILAAGGVEARYLGELRGEALRAWVESIDIMVLPSRWFETGPLTLLESWDSGTPVLGTDLGGIQEFMLAQGLSDCLFPLESADGIAEAVMRLLTDAERMRNVEVPGMDELGRAMVRIYMSCLEGREPGFTPRRPRSDYEGAT